MRNEILQIAGAARELCFFNPPISPLVATRYVYGKPKAKGDIIFTIQISISGIQREIGEHTDHETALRYADCASYYFRKYRKGEPKYNFSEQQAIADLSETKTNGGELANFLLARLANLYRNEGSLNEYTAAPARTINRVRIVSRISELQQRIVALESQPQAIQLESRAADVLADVRSLKIDGQETNAELGRLNTAISELANSNVILHKQNNELLGRIRSLETQNNEFSNRISNLEFVAMSLQNELNDTNLKVASLRDRAAIDTISPRCYSDEPTPQNATLPTPQTTTQIIPSAPLLWIPTPKVNQYE